MKKISKDLLKTIERFVIVHNNFNQYDEYYSGGYEIFDRFLNYWLSSEFLEYGSGKCLMKSKVSAIESGLKWLLEENKKTFLYDLSIQRTNFNLGYVEYLKLLILNLRSLKCDSIKESFRILEDYEKTWFEKDYDFIYIEPLIYGKVIELTPK